MNEKAWFKSEDSQWTTNGKATKARDPHYGAEMLHVEWAESEKAPVVEVTSKVAAQDRAVDLSKPGDPSIKLAAAERKFNTAGSELIPVDGIVKQTSDKIVAGKTTEIEKVHAIYEWIVENTYRDAKVRGCGIGDIAAMLKTGNLGGKCADLNALFVGLVRAADIPARDVYGIRVAPSKFGYKALGAGSEVIHQGAALPRRDLSLRLWLGRDRSRRRAQGRARGAAGKPGDRQSEGGGGAPDTVRRLGRQLARLQHRARRGTAGVGGSENRLPDVSAGRNRQHAARLSRSG